MRVMLVGVCCFLVAATGLGYDSAQALKENDEVMNGPLVRGGYTKVSEGTKESLELAIKDLMATHGNKYPRGAEFMQRLVKMKDNQDPGFKALKREALLANPLLAFDKILMVKSRKGERHSKNWQTRASAVGEKSAIHPKELGRLLGTLGKKDKELGALNQEAGKLDREKGKLYGKIRGSSEFKAFGRDRKKQNDYLAKHPEYSKLTALIDDAKKKAVALAKKFPEYVKLEEQVKSRKQIANYDNQLTILSIKTGKETEVYGAEKYIGEVDLHSDGNKVLFTSFGEVKADRSLPSSAKGFRVFELAFDPESGTAKGAPRLAVPDLAADVDSYDACYLADGKIIFASTASYQGVPCVGGRDYVANLYRVNKDGSDVRRLTYDQEGNWSPTMMENGRVMFTRWEYTDSAHYFSRVLMTMNPDGTDQKKRKSDSPITKARKP